MAGFCRIWIPNFGLIAKSLFEALKGTEIEPLIWNPECQAAFKKLKHSLMTVPVLEPPDLQKEFRFYVCEKQGPLLTVRDIP